MATIPEGFQLESAPVQPAVQQIPAGFQVETPQSTFRGDVEQLAAIASGAVAEPIAGIAGIAQSINPFADEGAGARAVEATRGALTFQPRTEAGRSDLQITGEALSSLPDVSGALGGFTFEQTGSPALAAAAAAAPTAIAEVLGLATLKNMRKGTRLITPEGRPTQALVKELDKKGLTFDNLTPEAKELIPAVADKNLIRIGSEVAGPAEQTLIKQITSGGSDDALAGLKVVKGRLAVDSFGSEAVKQGFEPGMVQLIKTADPATKSRMKQMVNVTKRIKSNVRVAQDIRPTDVVGDAMTDRIKFIRNTANKSRLDLDDIAKKELPGLKVEGEQVISKLQKSLDDLDVSLIDGPDGVPTPVFTGSQISKDRTSQRIIKDLIDLMAEGGKPDAIRMHKMKRQLDKMIDFRKKSAGGLTDAGKVVLKDVRSSLNNAIRDVSPAYAKVNDKLSQSLTALDDFKNVSGSSIDIFGEGSSAAIGQDLRGLMSNRKTRVKLENAVNNLDATAANLGGNFKDSVKDLANFADALDDRFGAIAKTSFKGEIESTLRGSAREAALKKTAQAVSGGLEKLKGVNDLNAFKSMDDLLSR